MNFKFKKIKLHNFFSFKDAELNLDNLGTSLVFGQNYCSSDQALSNGSGKSSLFSGICYALTGKTIQGVHAGVENIFGDSNDCWVELEFNLDEKNFIIKRIKTPWHMLKIFVDGKDISGKTITESEAIFKNYTDGLTLKKIGTSIIWGQGACYKFSNYVPAERKKVLEEFSNSTKIIEDLTNKLNDRYSLLLNNNFEYQGKLSSLNAELEISKNKKLDYENKLSIKFEDNLEEIEKSIKLLEDEITSIDNKKEYINKQISELNEKISKSNSKKLSKLSDVQTKYSEVLNKFQQQILEKKHELKIVKEQLRDLENAPEFCPYCHQKMPAADKNKVNDFYNKKDSLEKELENLNNEFENQKNTLNNEKKSIDLQFDEKGSKKSLEELNSLIKSLNSSEQKNNLKELKNKYQELKQVNDEFLLNKKLLEDVKINIERLNDSINEIINIQNDNQIHLEVVKNLLSIIKKDFRSVLLSQIVSQLNSILYNYSNVVFSGANLRLDFTKLGINIYFNNKIYENLSGGERQKIDLIIQLALRDLLSMNGVLDSNILCLDEIFDNLDAIGCKNILELISRISSVSSLFIISHHSEDLEISYDKKITVEKFEDLGSIIKVE